MMADVSEEKTGLADVIAKVLNKKIPEGAKSAVLAKVNLQQRKRRKKRKRESEGWS
eukprot:m.172477 g.172477  ORF g.172477 m.172477 type:complete len:56 (+) comp15369_c0_seq3:149-316(+)